MNRRRLWSTSMITIKTAELVSPTHAAQRVGISVRRLLQLADSGQVTVLVDSSGRRVFPVEGIERLQRDRARKAAK
jgi:predicted site-specific integrase-resolvase